MLVRLDYARLTGQSVGIGDVLWLGDTEHGAFAPTILEAPPPHRRPEGTFPVLWSRRQD